MAADVKIAYLKSLQGYLWKSGYASGALSCPLFPDVYPMLQKWHSSAAGIKIVIYSSGSVAAQKLLFQYTNSVPDPDLRPLITDYFDTVNAGLKQDEASYQKIAAAHPELGAVGEWFFLSDNVKEVEAAKEAGMQAAVVVREGNAPLTEGEHNRHFIIERFDEIDLRGA
ncbi:hypothetical protein BP6252_01483 [Coleophoma cylindrospora]|uniref:Enolase-phosphatase E1 n=1 Tax=Coleophoma cylindrospora TaxID=1849047 RepID=A0A3D8STF3_9HELO|nr:hypothetical protein BP6252_01483 [Coleophoma cylindrospora]